ncbi:unnamed protein product [Adineta steineri]|uniref:Uncharacterized protein n=1 Tax=Adineta steineri TaxID=433720 RepID=A0A815D430_9BILA|nr:unnamed protein product [Adineta steineri]
MTDSPTDASVNTTSSHVFHRSLVNEPLLAVRAEGNYIYLKDGRKLLDGSGGAAVTNIGHGDKRVIAGILDQLQTVDYVHSGTFSNKTAEELAIELTKDSGMARAIFVSGGSEAIESAIKLARQYHLENKQSERINFIARQQSYHGNTLGALGLCRHTARRAPFLPYFSSHFHHVSPCFAYHYKLDNESDEDYVNRLADELEAKFQELGPHTVAAFFAETIVGATSGCTPAVPGYFKAMRNVCDRHGALFVLDEIMCGIGRTGKMHAWQWEDLSSPPDIQVLGKGLGKNYVKLNQQPNLIIIGYDMVLQDNINWDLAKRRFESFLARHCNIANAGVDVIGIVWNINTCWYIINATPTLQQALIPEPRLQQALIPEPRLQQALIPEPRNNLLHVSLGLVVGAGALVLLFTIFNRAQK